MKVSFKQYSCVIINHHDDDWVQRLLMSKFAANTGVSETMMCTPLDAVQRPDPLMILSEAWEASQYQQPIDAEEVQSRMEKVLAHLRVGIRQSQTIQEENVNHSGMPAQNIQEGSRFRLEACHVRTTRLICKSDSKWLGPYTVDHQI